MPILPDLDRLNSIYSNLLSLLDLTNEHRHDLNSRGFADSEISTYGYKSLPVRRREVVDKLAKKYKDNLSGVPGFWLNDKGSWELAGKCGILIPIRERDGKISGIKIRVDKPSSPSSKYLLLSSNPKPDPKTGEVKYPSGTPARISIHWPLTAPKKLQVLRITEGELKADIVVNFLPEYTISIPGVTMWRMAIDLVREEKPEKVLLAFDSDKSRVLNTEGSFDSSYVRKSDTPHPSTNTPEDFAVGKALSSLYLALKEEGVNVAVEDWPIEAGKGIDDVLVSGSTDKIRLLTDEEAGTFSKDLLQGDNPRNWVYVVGVKRFYHTYTQIELDKEQFADRYYHEAKGNPALKALSNPAFPKVDLPIYLPNKEQRFTVNEKRYFNTWRPNAVKPSPGKVDLFLEHCAYIIPDEEERNIFLDWLSFNVQFPGIKIMWAILMQGIQGTGKSYFGTLMRLLLGAHNVSSPTNDLIHEVYTAWQKSCQLVIIEELMARGRMELMNKLKPMITQEITVVREMHRPAYEQPNVFNLLMFTNHQDAVILDETDRRYCVIFSPATPKSGTYYEELWSWTESNAPALLNYMGHRDLGSFKPKGHAPMTSGKRELINLSKPPLEMWMSDLIENERWPFQGDLVSTTHLIECLPRNLQASSLQAIGRTLKTIGAIPQGQVKLKDGGSVRLWSVRRHAVWSSAEKETLAAEYERWSMNAQPGGNPMMDAKPM